MPNRLGHLRRILVSGRHPGQHPFIEALRTAQRGLPVGGTVTTPAAEATREAVAPQVGMAAMKYADLSVAHDSEYVFDLERMIAPTGNTGPYIQYAAARMRSIFHNVGLDPTDSTVASASVVVGSPEERALSLQLLEMGPTLLAVGTYLEPHRLCSYLFSLAQTFSVFYVRCPVLKAEDETVRASRLALCAATLRTLVTGLDLLGIEAPDRM